jgi:hypothetical protein
MDIPAGHEFLVGHIAKPRIAFLFAKFVFVEYSQRQSFPNLKLNSSNFIFRTCSWTWWWWWWWEMLKQFRVFSLLLSLARKWISSDERSDEFKKSENVVRLLSIVVGCCYVVTRFSVMMSMLLIFSLSLSTVCVLCAMDGRCEATAAPALKAKTLNTAGLGTGRNGRCCCCYCFLFFLLARAPLVPRPSLSLYTVLCFRFFFSSSSSSFLLFLIAFFSKLLLTAVYKI